VNKSPRHCIRADRIPAVNSILANLNRTARVREFDVRCKIREAIVTFRNTISRWAARNR